MPQFIIADKTHHNHAIAVARLDTLMQDYADLQQVGRARFRVNGLSVFINLTTAKNGTFRQITRWGIANNLNLMTCANRLTMSALATVANTWQYC